MTEVEVEVSARLSQDGKPPSENVVEASINQCVADAVEGSFDEFPAHLRPVRRLKGRLLRDYRWEPAKVDGHVTFAMGIPATLFPVRHGGLQLLVSLLAGDIFPTEVSGCLWSQVEVQNIKLPDDIKVAAVSSFRDSSAHDIESIRAAFRLPVNRPLLAYSLKPRVGPNFNEIRRFTLDVLDAGFNIVELDARHLALSTAPIERWLELGIEAARTGTHGTAFSPNFSIPAPQLVDVAAEWVDGMAGQGPAVFKVDGGLDGMTSLQAIRTAIKGEQAPIITSYPLLRNQLTSAIGVDTWSDLLAMCGADVVYPGGRPTFPNERRPVFSSQARGWSRAARVYDATIERGWPMPTVAGGIRPGDLHACYELLGPNVAYFLGGAVALHPKSVRDGAKLCVAVLEAAIGLAEEAEQEGDAHAVDLPTRLLGRIEAVKYPSVMSSYVPPSIIFGLPGEAPKTFYRRRA